MPVRAATKSEEDEFPFQEKTVVINGHSFSFRELSVQENDDCADSAKDEKGIINGRTMMRMMIVTSSIKPKLTPEKLAKMPQRVYGKIYDVVNDLQNPDTLASSEDDSEPVIEDDAGNA